MKKSSKNSTPNIVEFTTDPQLLGLSISEPQETLLRASDGLPLSSSQMDIFHLCTGRERYSGHAFGEITALEGARSGKDSRFAAPKVCYEGIFGGHEKFLAKGERAVVGPGLAARAP